MVFHQEPIKQTTITSVGQNAIKYNETIIGFHQ